MDHAVTTLKALADRNRLRIVQALGSSQELCACQITGLLEVTGATTSRHLGVLEQAGLVAKRRDGRWIWYRLNQTPGTAALLAWIQDSTADEAQTSRDRQSLREILAIDPSAYCRLQRGATSCSKTEKTR